jgi:D-alanyl-D-alanine dipeptidase
MKKMFEGLAWFAAISAAILVLMLLMPDSSGFLSGLLGFFGTESQEHKYADITKSTEKSTTVSSEVINIEPISIEPINYDDYDYYDGDLELPVNGATGYASVDIGVMNSGGERIAVLKAGAAFLILREDLEWWLISVDGIEGWVRHNLCMINLPDVIPSIIYDNTNAYGSVCFSSGEFIPGLTGEALYSYSDRRDGKAYNSRFENHEYIIPVLYSMSKRIWNAQKFALANGDTLIIYEGYRPYSAQKKAVAALQSLANENSYVRTGLSAPPWSMGWFVATGISNHQRGYAVDLSLGQTVAIEDAISGDYKHRSVTLFQYYQMPTQIGELSVSSVAHVSPNSSELSEGMKNNIYAQNLRKYCTDAGLTPLASEWWHFNDEHTRRAITNLSDGNYEVKECLSVPPNSQ